MNNITNVEFKRIRANSIRKNKRTIGALGERLVVKYLESKGFSLVCANYYKKYGEIDLVMEFHEKLHFIEVKTVSREIRQTEGKYVIHETLSRRKGESSHTPEENISPRKLRRISRVVAVYLAESKTEGVPWQFDIGLVFLDRKNKKALIKIIKDTPLPA